MNAEVKNRKLFSSAFIVPRSAFSFQLFYAAPNTLLHNRLVSETLKPLYSIFAAKPRQLPFSIMTNIQLCLFDGAFKRAFPTQVFDYAAVTVSAERVRFCGHAFV